MRVARHPEAANVHRLRRPGLATSLSSCTATSSLATIARLRTGFAKIDEFKVMLVGHHKGKTLKERNECYFGCAHPEGYRKAMEKMRAGGQVRACQSSR